MLVPKVGSFVFFIILIGRFLIYNLFFQIKLPTPSRRRPPISFFIQYFQVSDATKHTPRTFTPVVYFPVSFEQDSIGTPLVAT